jgi:hypothetical protein
MSKATYRRVVEALRPGGKQPKRRPRLAVVVTSQGAVLAWEDTLMPDFGIPVDVYDGATHALLHKGA